MLHVMAVIRVQPEHMAAASAAMKTLAAQSRSEPGCARYEVFQRNDEAVLVTQETWFDAAAEAAHMSGANVAAAFAAIGSRLTAVPEVHRYMQIT